MSEPIKIVVTAETAAAAASLQQFAAQAGSGFNKVAQDAAAAGAATTHHMGGMVYQFRSAMDAIRFAAMDGGPRAAFYAVDEALRAVMASGVKLSTLVPYISAVGAAAAVLGAEWYLVMGSVANTTKQNEEWVKSMDKVAEALKKIQALQRAGIMSTSQASDLSNQLTGRKKMYVDHDGNLTPNPTETYETTVQTQMGYSPVMSSSQQMVTRNNRPATQEELLASAQGKTQMSKDQLDALEKIKELEKQAHMESLAGIEKETVAIHDKYELQRREILETAQLAGAPITAGGVRDPDVDKRAAAAVAELNAGEAERIAEAQKKIQDERARKQEESAGKIRVEEKQSAANDLRAVEDQITADQEKAGAVRGALAQQEYKLRVEAAQRAFFSGEISEDEYTHLVQEAAHKRTEAEKQYNAELKKEVELNHAIAQAETEAQLKAIKDNPFLTGAQKTQQSVPVLQSLMTDNAGTMSDLRSEAANSSDESARLEALRQYTALQTKQVELQHEYDEAVNAGNWGYQFEKAITSLQTFTTLAQESAQAFEKAWDGADNAISGGLTHLFMYGAQKGQWFVQLWNGMCESMISSVTHLVVDWVMKHGVMVAAEEAFYALCTAMGWTHLAAVTAAKLAEVGVHVGAEATKTTGTTSGATTQIAANAATAGSGAASAMAGIPYLGPVLAIAAMGAMIAAVLALSGGFEAGGYTGGTRGQAAGVVHGEEFVFSAPAVDRIGRGTLEALHNGAGVTGAPASGPAHSQSPSIYAFTDPRQMADHMEKNNGHEKWVVDVMRRNIHKFR